MDCNMVDGCGNFQRSRPPWKFCEYYAEAMSGEKAAARQQLLFELLELQGEINIMERALAQPPATQQLDRSRQVRDDAVRSLQKYDSMSKQKVE
jgi:hypothetical protein